MDEQLKNKFEQLAQIELLRILNDAGLITLDARKLYFDLIIRTGKPLTEEIKQEVKEVAV